MPKRKSLASIDRKIEETQNRLIAIQARYEKVAKKLQALQSERKLKQAELIADALAKSGKNLEDVLTFLRC